MQTNGKVAFLRYSRFTLISINWKTVHIGSAGMRMMDSHWVTMAALTFMAVSALSPDFGYGADTCAASGGVPKGIACARPISEVLDAAPTPQSVSSQPAATDLFASDPQAGDFRHIEMVRLETDVAHDQRTPGVRQRPRSDHEVAHYTKMITRDRKNDNAYFRRGIANLYAGALPRALSDMVRASELDPTYAYYALWLDILSKRYHQASRLPQAVSQIDMTKWPAPIIHMFLGQVTPAAVLIAADDPDARTKKDQLCEANFYIAEFALQQGTNEEATRRFRVAAADCPHRFNFVEGAAAYAELKALGVSP
jgi:hypothetical protein